MVWLLGHRPTIQRLESCVQGDPGTLKEDMPLGQSQVSKPSSHTLVSTRDHPPWTSVHQRPSTVEEALSSHGNGKAKTGTVSWHRPRYLALYHELLCAAPWCWAPQPNSPFSVANLLLLRQSTQPESSEDRCCAPREWCWPWRGPSSLSAAS